MFVTMDFQALKLQFYSCYFKQAFYSLHKLYDVYRVPLTLEKYFHTIFSFDTWLLNLHV